MLKFQSRVSTIAPEQFQGSFADAVKGNTVSFGATPYGFYAVIRNAAGESVLVNASKRVKQAIANALNGVVSATDRLQLVTKAFNECQIIETEARNQAKEDGSLGDLKHDANGHTIPAYYAVLQGDRTGLTEEQYNASVAKAATFSLKNAMSNRV